MNKKLFVLFIVLVLIVGIGFLFSYDKKVIEAEKQNTTEQLNDAEGTEQEVTEDDGFDDELIGTLKIEKIDLDGTVKEGSTNEILKDYIGHIEETAKYDGNVGLAAHNRGNKYSYFARINELEPGDEIVYTTKYGERKYIVNSKKEILETDWRQLEGTQDNRLTLITCIKNKVNQRLCVQAVQENIYKERTNMNKLKKLLVILQILMLLWPTAFTVASTINIGDTINIERGDLGFYSIQYWNENRGMWMYKTYSRTYYTDKDGSKKIAYCMDQDLDGVGWLPGEDENYDTEVKYELKDEKIWRVLKNGYPNVSPEQLGVETEDDAYLATKQAVYWVIKYRNVEGGNAYNVYTHFRAGETEINNQNLDDIQRRGKKVIDAIYNLVNIAFWNEQEVQQDPEIVDIGQYEEDENPEYCIKRYQVTDTGIDAEVRITGIEWKSQKLLIVDENENPKTEFKPGDIIKVMIPKKEILENSKLKIYYTKTMEDFPVYYTASKIEGRQNYVILLDKTRESTGTINFDVGGDKSELQIVKIDAETSRPLEGVTFSIT